MRITTDSPISEVAAVVADALFQAGVRAVLTGGACAAIYKSGLDDRAVPGDRRRR